jgi:hypothetical protein
MSKAKDEGLDPHTLESVRDSIADTMHAAARAIADPEERASAVTQPPGGMDWKHKTSQWLDHWSEEVRRWDASGSEVKLRDAIATHPGRILVMAGVVGLILGATLRRR